ncbi:hypothetical protein [Anaerosporobacter sp.]|uniref:hypothetical protein n=1 Tax=Anaerosporobacter sp. TaxID=1872529 RepID=UPI00286EC30D|nr:hypothetical protein [Anaerosporobacter sp.]
MTNEDKAKILEFEKNMQQSDNNDKSIDFYRNEYQKLIDEVNQYKTEYEELVRQELEIKNAYQQALDSLLSKME